jgi:hypothetical protein
MSSLVKFTSLQKELEMDQKQLPKGALRFVDEGHGCQAFVDFAEGEEKTPKLSMVGYSGKIIKGHWYWGDLAIDLQGMKFEQKRYPILEDHNTERKIGFMGKPVIDDKGQLMAPDNAVLLDTEAAQEFINLSRKGFPYQSSISARPLSIERLEQGASAEVNGYTMKGPGTIWRESKFREISCCVFGWDSKTSASAFSREPIDVDFEEKVINAENDLGDDDKPKLKRREVKKIMNLDEFKQQHSDIYDQVFALGQKAAEEKFSKEKSALEGKLEQMAKDNESLSEKVLDLEKKDIIRTESELKVQATSIWREKLSASKIPERYYDKIQLHVSYSKFVDDGKFNTEEFSKAVDSEIKDWEDRGMTETVMGSSFTTKEVTDADIEKKQKQEENDMAVAKKLLKHVGQDPDKDKNKT